ncbi:MAG: 6-carboxytetrahydropterin synthase [Chitinophagaceae bacterium]|nr:MAG: 6-carboxytetrahydropterin synthase [Chitinophagaceae bacterium]
MNNKVAVIRKEHFNAAHRLFNSNWDDATNEKVFGKCSWPNYHGHNYELEVKVTGIPNPTTGCVINLKVLSELVKKEIHSRFDHKNLNLDTDEFKDLIPTAENIILVIYNLLRPHIQENMDLHLRLYETSKNFVEYPVV